MFIIYGLNYTDKVWSSKHAASATIEPEQLILLQCLRRTSHLLQSTLDLLSRWSPSLLRTVTVPKADFYHRDLHLFYHQADGKLNTGRYSNTTTIYYVGFVAGAPIMAMVARRYPTGKVCAAAVTAWGLTCMVSAPLSAPNSSI